MAFGDKYKNALDGFPKTQQLSVYECSHNPFLKLFSMITNGLT